MRVDKSDPHQVYTDFWDWITRDWHIILLMSLLISYIVYLYTTEEV